MNALNHQRLRLSFQSVGYSQRDYLDKTTLLDILGKLGNEDFDVDIFEQLWEQCRLNSQGKTKIETFNDNVIRAEAILMQKQKQTTMAMNGIIAKMMGEANLHLEEKVNLQGELEQLKQVQAGFAIDLQILRKPFLKFSMETVYHKDNSSLLAPEKDIADSSAIIPISNKMNLTWVMDLCVFCLAALIFVTLYINTFMNTVLFLLILSLCLFGYFDRMLIRFLFWAVLFTLVVDIVWFCIRASSLWNPHSQSNQAHFLNKYMRFIIVLISFIFLAKVLIAMLLCSEYNIDQTQPQRISLFCNEFILRKEKQSPIRKALGEILKMQQNVSVIENSHVSK